MGERSRLRIFDIGSSPAGAGEDVRLEATVAGLPGLDEGGFRAWIEIPPQLAPPEEADASPWLVAMLPAAVTLGVPIEVEGAVSARLLAGARKAMAIWHGWNRLFRAVEIRGASEGVDHQPAFGHGCFFSGGIDSSYSVLKNLDNPTGSPIDGLIFAHGLDVPLEDRALRTLVAERLEATAGAYGIPFVEVATNLRSVTDPYADWGLHQHGPTLAAIGLAMSAGFGRVTIPATNTYDTAFPWGSHPLLDPLWSTDATEFVHDGCEAGRFEKLDRYVAKSDVALAGLRVCYRNPGGSYNCGACEKCLRTMLCLKALDVLDRCPTFDREPDPEAVSRLDLSGGQARIHAVDNLGAFERRGTDPELAAALRAGLKRRSMAREARKTTRRRLGVIRKRVALRLSKRRGGAEPLGSSSPGSPGR